MVKCFGIDNSNDIYLADDGNLAVKTGIEAIATACGTISRAQLGEMVLTTTQGIPNFETVWIGTPRLGIWQSYLRNALQNVPGVDEVSDLSYTINGGILQYIAEIKTQFGPTQIVIA